MGVLVALAMHCCLIAGHHALMLVPLVVVLYAPKLFFQKVDFTSFTGTSKYKACGVSGDSVSLSPDGSVVIKSQSSV